MFRDKLNDILRFSILGIQRLIMALSVLMFS